MRFGSDAHVVPLYLDFALQIAFLKWELLMTWRLVQPREALCLGAFPLHSIEKGTIYQAGDCTLKKKTHKNQKHLEHKSPRCRASNYPRTHSFRGDSVVHQHLPMEGLTRQ